MNELSRALMTRAAVALRTEGLPPYHREKLADEIEAACNKVATLDAAVGATCAPEDAAMLRVLEEVAGYAWMHSDWDLDAIKHDLSRFLPMLRVGATQTEASNTP